MSPDLDVVKKSKGPVMTVLEEFYKVGPGPSSSHTIGPMRITYDFYQRCTKLPADQLAQGHGPQGSPLRQPERHRQGARHRARLAGRPHRQGAGHGRSAVPRRDDRQAEADLPGEARRQDVQPLARRHHLRHPQGRLPAPEHDDVQTHGRRQGHLRAGVLLARRRVLRVEGLHAAQEGPAEVSLRDDEGTARARGEEQALDRAGHHGQRGGRLRQDRGADQRVPRQDRQRDAGDREGGPRREGRRPARPHQAALEGGHRLGAGPGRQVRERPRHRAGLRLRPGRLGGERPRPPGHHRARRAARPA